MGSYEIPFAKISNPWIIQLFKFSQKFFPEHAKNLFGTRDELTVRDLQKCRIAPFARIPAFNPNLIHPTMKPERKNSPSFHSGIAQTIRQAIARPKEPVSAFFQARFMPNPARQSPNREYCKTIDLVY